VGPVTADLEQHPLEPNSRPTTTLDMLAAIYDSQQRTETMVRDIVETVGPMVETVRTKGVLGLLSTRAV